MGRVLAVCGLPGSGKGEFALVMERNDIPILSMGDMVRAEVRSRGLDEASIAVVLRLSNWALQERRPELITHALVESGAYDATVFALLPVATTYVGGAYDSKLGANLEDAASESHACTSSSELAFISTRYLYSSSS